MSTSYYKTNADLKKENEQLKAQLVKAMAAIRQMNEMLVKTEVIADSMGKSFLELAEICRKVIPISSDKQ